MRAQTKQSLLLALAVASLAALVYAGSILGGFVYDDHAIVAQNPLVIGPLSIPAILKSTYWEAREVSETSGGLYRPFTMLTYAVNHRLSGGGPHAFHFINVMLHALASALVLLLFLRLGASSAAAAVGAAAFAVLPIHVEAVSWIVGRAELLGAVFALAAWWLLHERAAPAPVAAGLACYGLALLSKESSAALPAVWILGEAYRRRGTPRELLKSRLPYWILAFGVLAAYLSWRRAMLGSAFVVGPRHFAPGFPLETLLTMARFFLAAWVTPMATGLGLCADYSSVNFPNAHAGDVGAWAALAALAAGLAWTLRAFVRERAAWAFGVLVLLGLAVPVSNLLVPMEILGAERMQYLPSVGYCFLLAAAFEQARRRAPRGAAAAAATCLLWWAGASVARTRIWRDDKSFFTATAACAPAPRILSGLGMVADLEGRHEEARALFKRALELEPGFAQAAYHMGKSHYDAGDWRGAKPWFQSLVEQGRADNDTLCYLAMIAEKEGAPKEALGLYVKILGRDARHPQANYNAALLLYNSKERRKQLDLIRALLRAIPFDEDARALLGALEAHGG